MPHLQALTTFFKSGPIKIRRLKKIKNLRCKKRLPDHLNKIIENIEIQDREQVNGIKKELNSPNGRLEVT